jgi:hypothetical protein
VRSQHDKKTDHSLCDLEIAAAASSGLQTTDVANEKRWDDDGGHVDSRLPAFVAVAGREPFWSVMNTLDLSVKRGPPC